MTPLRWFTRSWILLGACGAACGGGHSAPAPAPGLVAALERTACFGTCPIYRIEVHRDGRLRYRGERFVLKTGEHEGRVGAAALAALDRAFAEARFAEMKDEYVEYQVTDAPSAVVTHVTRGRRKTVRHYHGDRSAPEALRALEDRIDEIVHIEDFIGTEAQRRSFRQR